MKVLNYEGLQLYHQLASEQFNNTDEISSINDRIDTLNTNIKPSDWEQTDSTAIDFIKNKPTILTSADVSAQIKAEVSVVDLIYPVGSIYMSVNSASPAELFGGTWEQIKDKFLLSAGDVYEAGATGGEAEHTLTIDEMPNHTHKMPINPNHHDTGVQWMPAYTVAGNGSPEESWKSWADNILFTGGSQPHNNMPPYLVVYVWQRTA